MYQVLLKNSKSVLNQGCVLITLRAPIIRIITKKCDRLIYNRMVMYLFKFNYNIIFSIISHEGILCDTVVADQLVISGTQR